MNNGDIILLGTMKFGFKELTLQDSKGFVNMRQPEYSLPTNFYGNQVANLAKTAYPGIYLCVDKRNKPLNILAKKDEIVELEPSEIRAILEAKGIPHAKNTTKKHLLSLLGIESNGSDEINSDQE